MCSAYQLSNFVRLLFAKYKPIQLRGRFRSCWLDPW